MTPSATPPSVTAPDPAAPDPAAPGPASSGRSGSPTPAADGATATAGRASGNLGAELRESLLLLLFAAGTTLGLTTAAQAALAALV